MLIDGAHNPAAAIALRQYVDTLERPVTWVMGMLSTKDHEDIFQALLKSGDELHLVPVPDHSSAEPKTLAALAVNVCPNLSSCQTYPDVVTALDTVVESIEEMNTERVTVLCGSLYLIGYLFGQTDILFLKSTELAQMLAV